MNSLSSENDNETYKPNIFCDIGSVSKLNIGLTDKIDGVCMLDGYLWLARSRTLYEFDVVTGELIRSRRMRVSRHVSNICSDGEYIFALEAGYGEGRSIYIFDPVEQVVIAKLVTNQNGNKRLHSAYGMDYYKGFLYVLARAVGRSDRCVFRVDPENGNILEKYELELDVLNDSAIHGLACVGNYFICLEVLMDEFSGSSIMHYFDSSSGKHVGGISLNSPITALTHSNGKYYFPVNTDLNNIQLMKDMNFIEQDACIYELTIANLPTQ